MILEPRLIITTGMATGGKSTLAKAIVRAVDNSAYLARDDAMYAGGLVVNDITMKTPGLPSFAEYVERDTVFPDFIEEIETPFGPMHRVIHANHNDFFWRHADRQSYLLAARFAERLLELGKVVVIDTWLSGEHFKDGTVARFLGQPAFGSVPRRLIYFTVGLEEAFRRWHERAAADPESDLRGASGYLKWETFVPLMEKEQPSNPEGLEKIPHLSLDTTNISIEDALERCLTYIRS